jgi:hypothetical protein
MKKRLEYIKDSVGQNYIGIKIYMDEVFPFLEELKDILGDDYEEFTKLQSQRDRGSHHITVINVFDTQKLIKEMGMDQFSKIVDNLFEYEIDDIRLMGIGMAQRNENSSYFIVVNSDKLKAIRDRFNLPDHDFHITIGFLHRDVFGVRKNQILPKKEKFIKLLSQEFYNNQNFDFIKDIINYPLDKSEELFPIDITNTSITFRNESGKYISVGLIDDIFRVVAIWDGEKKPYLAETLVRRKLNLN